MADQESAVGNRINFDSTQFQSGLPVQELDSILQRAICECKEKIAAHISVIRSTLTEDGRPATGSSMTKAVNCEIEKLVQLCCYANSNSNSSSSSRSSCHNDRKLPDSEGDLVDEVCNSLSVQSSNFSNMEKVSTRTSSSCQTDSFLFDNNESESSSSSAKLKQLTEEFENYKKEVENIIQASLKVKERELELKFEGLCQMLRSVEVTILDKLNQSEHHANCLHAALKSAMVELGNLKNKIDECSTNSTSQNCTPVDLRSIQANSGDFRHLNGNYERVVSHPSNSQMLNGLGTSSSPPPLSTATSTTTGFQQSTKNVQNQPIAASNNFPKTDPSDEEASAKSHLRSSSADHVNKQDDRSFVPRPPTNLTSKVPLFPDGHPFLLNFKYPALTAESLLANYFPPALFCLPPPTSIPLLPTTSSSSSSSSTLISPAATTLSSSQYLLPNNINPFKKFKFVNNLLTSSSTEGKAKVVFPVISSQNVLKLPSINTSSSPPTQATHVSSSPSSLPGYPTIDTFQPTKIEPLDVTSPDTAEIAQRVRDILSAHNIGQRQFAREVLGLSQGTVSELLSKPKPWDKLTEKGRESYRKMLAWTQEENNYLELKMSNYKNGQSSVMQPSSSFASPSSASSLRADETSTELRISQILMQAQAAINNQTSMSRTPKLDIKANGEPSQVKGRSNQKSTHSRDFHGSGCKSSAGECEGISRKSEFQGASNDSLSFVTRIYREQLLELLKTAEKNKNQAEIERYRSELIRISSQASSSSSVPANNIDNSPADSTGSSLREEVKKEPLDRSDVDYCSKLSSNSDGPEDLSFGKSKNQISLVNCKEEPKMLDCLEGGSLRQTESGSMEPILSQLQLLPTDQNSCKPETQGSPLKQMQSITNSIISTCTSSTTIQPSPISSFQPQHLSTTRLALPPIDQETWEKCANLNTDDIVQRVKELLSEYCISQRLFGEHVLGLSQGSVSDLLARPKPWYMLTHKGREPFVRMKCFLDEPQSVHSLVSNQYKVPADKLLRMNSSLVLNGTAASSVTASLIQSSTPSNLILENPNIIGRKRKCSSSTFEESSNNGKSDSEQSGTSMQTKKNRISFTDDQKKLLRQTYKKNPYPLHSTIEQLASTLEVGVKTIVNWFHNHRMRDKSRFVSSHVWDSNQSSDPGASPCNQDGNFSGAACLPLSQIKSEDQSSQSCDSSSDFFLFFCNNNNNTTLVNNNGQELIPDPNIENIVPNEVDNVDPLRNSHIQDGEEASEPEDVDETGERPKREMKVVSKRKSARPQKMSLHYVADKSNEPNVSPSALNSSPRSPSRDNFEVSRGFDSATTSVGVNVYSVEQSQCDDVDITEMKNKESEFFSDCQNEEDLDVGGTAAVDDVPVECPVAVAAGVVPT